MLKDTEIAIVAAMDEKRGIGRDGRLPWNIPADLTRFNKLTTEHPVIMGMNTYESILEMKRERAVRLGKRLSKQPLSKRTNIVISRRNGLALPLCVVRNSLELALDYAKSINHEKVWVIGGGQVYQQALPLVDKLYLTIVEGDHGANVFFPDYSEFGRFVEEEGPYTENGFNFRYLTLARG